MSSSHFNLISPWKRATVYSPECDLLGLYASNYSAQTFPGKFVFLVKMRHYDCMAHVAFAATISPLAISIGSVKRLILSKLFSCLKFFFLPAKSQLRHQTITWTNYPDSARGADNGRRHGLSARAGNACVSPYCDTAQLGVMPLQAMADGLREHREGNDPIFQFILKNNITAHLF